MPIRSLRSGLVARCQAFVVGGEARRIARAIDRGQDLARVREEDLARWEELHPTRGSGEERSSDLVLECADLTRYRGLRDAKAARTTTDVAFFGDGDEITDLGEAHVAIVPARPPGRKPCERGSMGSRFGFEPTSFQQDSLAVVRALPLRGARLAERLARPMLDGARPMRIATPLLRDPRSKRYWTVERRPSKDGSMAIEILSAAEIEKMRRAGLAAADTLAWVGERIRPGVTTLEIDRWVREDTARRGGKPSQLGYKGFPAAVCTSKNEIVCHGIPSAATVLAEGDIVNVDVTTNLDGYHGDTSETFIVGETSADARRLVDVARRCRDAGVAVVREGARIGDIGAAIQELAKREGVTVVTELGGHGIGRKMHAEPHVSHTGKRGAGLRLKAGMAITIEPMVNLGRADVVFLDDDWTVVTADGGLSAQFEHTVIVTKDGHEITTLGPRAR